MWRAAKLRRTFLGIILSIFGIVWHASAQSVRDLTPEEAYDFLVRYFPLGRNSEDFFEWLRNDEAARERYNQILQSASRLKRFAEQGNRYRSIYESQFEFDFPTESSHRPWIFDPYKNLVKVFEAFLHAQESHRDALMRPHVARNTALQMTINRYQLPTGTSESDIRAKNWPAWEYYRRQIFRLEQQDELRKANNPKALDEAFRSWKQRTIEEIDAARVHNLRRAVERIIEMQGGAVYLGEVLRRGFLDTPIYGKVGEINADTVFQINIEFDNSTEKEIKALPEVDFHNNNPREVSFRHLLKQSSKFFIRFLTHSPLRVAEGIDGNEKRIEIARRASETYSKEHIPMTATVRFSEGQFTIPLATLLNGLLGTSRNMVGTAAFETEVVRKYLFEAFSRETALRQSRAFLEKTPSESAKGFQARLNRWIQEEAGIPIQDVRDLTHRLRARGFETKNDLVAGIEWYGFLASPFFWQRGDMPHIRLLQLGTVIRAYASNEINLDALKNKLQGLFPGERWNGINHPLELQEALREVAKAEAEKLDRVARLAEGGENRIYREYVQPSVVSQIKEYYQLLAEIPWYPVTPGVRTSTACKVTLKKFALSQIRRGITP